MDRIPGLFSLSYWKEAYLNWLTRLTHSWNLLMIAAFGDIDTVEATFSQPSSTEGAVNQSDVPQEMEGQPGRAKQS